MIGSYEYRYDSHGHHGHGIWGSAILSRWPLSNGRAIPTPVLIDSYPKPITCATLTHPTIGKVFATHITLTYSINVRQVNQLVMMILFRYYVILSIWRHVVV
jgi:hypothetical protein